MSFLNSIRRVYFPSFEPNLGLRRFSAYQPFVEFLRVTYVVLVWDDGVDEPFSLVYALAAFIIQEASLGWTVGAYLTILPKPSQKIT